MASAPPEFLKTDRVTLRKMQPSDAQSMFEEYAGDPRVTRFLVTPTQTSRADADRFVAERVSEWNAGTRWTYSIALTEAEDRAVGRIGLKVTSEGISVGYALAYKLFGQGLAPEAVQALYPLALARDPRVFARVHVENRASVRVLEKCGFHWSELRPRSAVFPNIGPEPCDCAIYVRSA